MLGRFHIDVRLPRFDQISCRVLLNIRFKMDLSRRTKRALHIAFFLICILLFQFYTGGLRFLMLQWLDRDRMGDAYAVERIIIACLLIFIRLLRWPLTIIGAVGCDSLRFVLGDFQPSETFMMIRILLWYVLVFMNFIHTFVSMVNFLGLILLSHPFPEKIRLKKSPLHAPFICFRTVTKGDYPHLISDNIKINMEICRKVGLEKFCLEVVTDKPLDLPTNRRVREIVVPTSYQTKSKALFKARALQYCLEDDVDMLGKDDWIVHLDEETLLTENSVRGILNFCSEGKHQFGQGVVTYAGGEIVNWITTFADSMRVAVDMGVLRFQFHYIHRPLTTWKGSFIVAQASAERRVGFDHGPDGSISEDTCFAMIAWRDGYSFGFVEGEMHEKSPFTCWDFVKQRNRWAKGLFLMVKKKGIPVRVKFVFCMFFYAWVAMPFCCTIAIVISATGPFPSSRPHDTLVAFCCAVHCYMTIFGAIKQFGNRYQQNRPLTLVFFSLAALYTIPFCVIAESIAIIWALCGGKHEFYVVRKSVAVEPRKMKLS